ncbi:MAG TPA: alpha/beta hydrolase [Candidatus Binataceae bacterium]|jgi:pimeloyl-ACP methyl ester carboxylesterase|nr:alpha/beta hydrolase [Candidatus Binataceae bacterium]
MRNRKFAGARLEINCVDYGGEGRKPLLFIHGGSACGHWWDFVAPSFTGSFHTLAMDLRGHGESAWSSGGYAMADYTADVAAMVESWGLGDPVLVGHSRGGLVALTFAAAKGSKVRALAIIDSLPQTTEDMLSWSQSMKSWRPRRYATLEQACASFRLLPAETRAAPAMLQQIARFCYRQEEDGGWVVRIDPRSRARDAVDVFDHLGAVTCPILIVKGTLSPMITPEVAKRMAAAAPQGSTAEIEDAYHHVMLDNPKALARTLNEFLAPLI